MEKKQLKKRLWAGALWLLLLGGSLTGAVFAWFTFSPDTNVQPMQGNMVEYESEIVENVVYETITETVTETITEQLPDGLALEISNDPDGTYSEECELILSGLDELFPISTNDLNEYFISIKQDENGISTEYSNISEYVDSYSLHGKVYLRARNGSCDVVLNPEKTSFEGSNQIIAASRIALIFRDIETKEVISNKIYHLNSMGDVSNVLVRDTVPNKNTVVNSVNEEGVASYTADPAVSISELFTNSIPINQDQVIEVEYRLYLEGCDENCYNVVMNNEINMSFGFMTK